MNARLLTVALALGCTPEFAADPARVDAPRVLAVQAEPAEAAPGESVTLTALIAAPDGTKPAAAFAFCTTPRAPAENRLAAPECLAGEPNALRPIDGIAGTLPIEACAWFGSTPPPPPPGETPRRPVDADATGGWYQPVRVTADGIAPAMARVRLTCALPGAPADIARRFAAAHRANQNPSPPRLRVEGDTVIAEWPADDAEPYLGYDATTARLETRTERLTLTWYAADAQLAPQIVGDATAAVDFITDGPTPRVWAVLRDDRGGLAFATLPLP